MDALPAPARGDVYWVNPSPTEGREQSGQRPCLVISETVYNQGGAELVVVVPITKSAPKVRLHVAVAAGDAALKFDGAILCDQIRSISRKRLRTRQGSISRVVLSQVEDKLKVILGLP